MLKKAAPRNANAPLAGVLIAAEVVIALLSLGWVRGDVGVFAFATPWVLALLAPVLVWGIWTVAKPRVPMLRFSYTGLAGGVPQSVAEVVRPAVQMLAIIGLCFLVIAAARPQSVRAGAHDAAEGIDIVIALDVSGSMEAADFKPNNRLFVAKEVLAEFVNQRKSDRIGLIVFAGEAFTQVPLTLDYSVLVNLLGDIRTGVITDGTAIGDALGTAVNRCLRDQPEQNQSRVAAHRRRFQRRLAASTRSRRHRRQLGHSRVHDLDRQRRPGAVSARPRSVRQHRLSKRDSAD